MSPRSMEGCSTFIWPARTTFRVGVERGASQQQVVAFGRAINQALRLLESDREEVESDVEIDRRTGQAVIADDRDVFRVRRFHDAPRLAGIVRQKHENIDALLEQLVDLAKLQVIVAIGGAGDDGASEFMGALLKFVELGLPTLVFHVLDGRSYLDFRLLRLRNSERQDDENERNSGEKTRRGPHESISQGSGSPRD